MLALVLVAVGLALRVLPHEANIAPIAAIALFGGVYLKRSQALVLPLAALVLSDFIIGFDSINSRLTVYGSFFAIGLIGLLIRRHKNLFTIVAGSVTGSVVFYLVTNFVFFYPPTMYTHDFNGMISSYINALPFFRNTLIGDLFFTGLFFGTYELIKWQARKSRTLQLTN